MSFPKLTSLLLLVLLALPAKALTLAELEKSYESKRTEIRLEKVKSMDTLKESYLGALARIEAKFQRAGRLDEVLLIKDETKDISEGKWPLAALPNKISLDVSAPRKIFLKRYIENEQDAARKTADTADKMLAILDQQAVTLTKAGDLQQALLARQIKTEIEADATLASARKLLANVLSDGTSRPALRIRRYGDNKEVIVRYDMRGKISPESPVSNVEEKEKAIGNTTAKTLGEFIGSEGSEADAALILQKTFDGNDPGGFALTEIEARFGDKFDGTTGMALSLKGKPVNPYASLAGAMPPSSSPGTNRFTIDYLVPKSNKGVTGFMLIQGTAGGNPLGDKLFTTNGKWVKESFAAGSTSESDQVLLYLKILPEKIEIDLTSDLIVLGSLKIEQIKFSAFVVERYGDSGVIAESFEDPAKQPVFATNGKLTDK